MASGKEFGRTYFDWSRQSPPPPVWEEVEKPAMLEGLQEVFSRFPVPAVTALDVGVGGAKTIDLLIEQGLQPAQITGIDVSREILSLAASLYPDIDFRHGDIADPKMLDLLADRKPFQLISCSMVLNHLDDNQLIAALSHMYALMADSGHFIAVVPYPKPSKKVNLIDDQTGFWLEDETPWGETVTYHHRSIDGYLDLVQLSGFIPSLKAFNAPQAPAEKTNRLLIVGRKIEHYKAALDREGLNPHLHRKHK